jgi:hypothetical protein
MERIPFDDPTSEARGNGVLEYLCHSLQLLASFDNIDSFYHCMNRLIVTSKPALPARWGRKEALSQAQEQSEGNK